LKGDKIMKYPHETEEQFIKRVKESKAQGICVFRDDNNREMILDLIDEYMDLVDSLEEDEISNYKMGQIENIVPSPKVMHDKITAELHQKLIDQLGIKFNKEH